MGVYSDEEEDAGLYNMKITGTLDAYPGIPSAESFFSILVRGCTIKTITSPSIPSETTFDSDQEEQELELGDFTYSPQCADSSMTVTISDTSRRRLQSANALGIIQLNPAISFDETTKKLKITPSK